MSTLQIRNVPDDLKERLRERARQADLTMAVAWPLGSNVVTCDGRLSRAPGTGVAVENVRVT